MNVASTRALAISIADDARVFGLVSLLSLISLALSAGAAWLRVP